MRVIPAILADFGWLGRLLLNYDGRIVVYRLLNGLLDHRLLDYRLLNYRLLNDYRFCRGDNSRLGRYHDCSRTRRQKIH